MIAATAAGRRAATPGAPRGVSRRVAGEAHALHPGRRRCAFGVSGLPVRSVRAAPIEWHRVVAIRSSDADGCRGGAESGEEHVNHSAWIRSGLLPGTMIGGRWRIDPDALDELCAGVYPMLKLPAKWRELTDGTPAPNWVAGIALSRIGR